MKTYYSTLPKDVLQRGVDYLNMAAKVIPKRQMDAVQLNGEPVGKFYAHEGKKHIAHLAQVYVPEKQVGSIGYYRQNLSRWGLGRISLTNEPQNRLEEFLKEADSLYLASVFIRDNESETRDGLAESLNAIAGIVVKLDDLRRTDGFNVNQDSLYHDTLQMTVELHRASKGSEMLRTDGLVEQVVRLARKTASLL